MQTFIMIHMFAASYTHICSRVQGPYHPLRGLSLCFRCTPEQTQAKYREGGRGRRHPSQSAHDSHRYRDEGTICKEKTATANPLPSNDHRQDYISTDKRLRPNPLQNALPLYNSLLTAQQQPTAWEIKNTRDQEPKQDHRHHHTPRRGGRGDKAKQEDQPDPSTQDDKANQEDQPRDGQGGDTMGRRGGERGQQPCIIHTCKHMYVQTHIQIQLHIHIHIYTYTHIHIYTFTHIHTLLYTLASAWPAANQAQVRRWKPMRPQTGYPAAA